jgi:hypothetical protein
MAASSTEGLTPAISVSEAWQRLNRTYALTLSTFVVFVNRVGEERVLDHEMVLRFWGGSHVCTPDGAVMAEAADFKPELLTAELDTSRLRRQRLILPFRRDDSLAFTLDVGRRILRSRSRRRDGLFGTVGRTTNPELMQQEEQGPAVDPPPSPTGL